MKFPKMPMFEMTLFDTILFKKSILSTLFSIGENRRSLAIVVVELLHLHLPLSYSGVDNSSVNV